MSTDYDRHGRLLNHLPETTVFYVLPSNENNFRKNAVPLSNKFGNNGFVRLFVSPDNMDVFGVCYLMQRSSYLENDYVYYYVQTLSAGALTPVDATFELDASTDATVFKGKQRNSFGPYLVMNEDQQSINWYGFTTTDASNIGFSSIFTSTATNEIAYLGSYEYYWWPTRSFMLARLGDGFSFQFFRFAQDFQTVAPNEATEPVETKIQQTSHTLLRITGAVALPPQFYGDGTVSYTHLRSPRDS